MAAVRSELNPADYASGGIKASETGKLERWRRGPEFLWREVEDWPPQPPEEWGDLLDTDEGVKKEKVTVGVSTVHVDFWSILFQRYSSWARLRIIVGCVTRVIF